MIIAAKEYGGLTMASEVRLIDANALRQTLESKIYWGNVGLLEAIDDAPTIDPESLRQKGRWEPMGEADYKCSVCGFRFTSGDPIEMFPYCRCGAKMEG